MRITVELSAEITNRLQAEAAAMGISSAALLAEIVTEIYSDTESTEEDLEIVAPVQEAIARYDTGERGFLVQDSTPVGRKIIGKEGSRDDIEKTDERLTS